MEPCDGTAEMLTENLNLLYQHRGKNVSAPNTPDTSFTGDSGYGSYFTPTLSSNNTPNQSSSLSSSTSTSTNLATLTSTPQRLSNTNSNLSTIFENPDSTKLTPVTQNIRNIHNFHISTPKDEQQQQQQQQLALGRKRNSVAILNFESTPKKSKFDEEFCLQAATEETLSANSTPRKNILRSTKKRAFRQNLKSAPDLSEYFNENHNAENEESPRRTKLSPIHCKSTTRVSRTPLSNSNSNLILASTPKSSSNSGVYDSKTSSVKKLLTFSDSKFEQLLKSGRGDKVESVVSKTTCFKKISSDLFENIDDDDSIKPLLDDLLTPSPVDCGDEITSEQASRNYKTVISSVLRDRELSFRELSSSRSTVQHAKQLRFAENRNGSTIKSATSTSTSKSNKDKTEPESQGFQDLLNINNDCHDMEISTICDCNKTLIEPVPTTNYNIKSDVDLELNATITCEMIAERSSSPVNTASSDYSTVPLPRTPKKSKPISIEHESLDILYPSIFRTPSKYNPLTRAPRKRKSDNDLWNSLVKRPCFYDGCDYLNIIAKLNESKCDHILDRIYENLSNPDLVNMCKVSPSWKEIVQSSRRATYRIKRHLKDCQISKENTYRENEKYLSCKEKTKEFDFQRYPLNQSNTRISQKRSIIRSPPVSPSKRKFHENQKVVKTLEPNEKLTKCPRCNKSSRIYKNNGLSGIKSFHQLRSAGDIFNRTIATTSSSSSRFNTLLSPTVSSFELTDASYSFNNNNNNNNITQKRLTKALSLDSKLLESETASQFAECSGLTCKYRFCLKCFCDYHPGNKCSLYEPRSPIDDDLQNGILKIASSPRSIKSARKKALKRLCL